MTLILSDDCHLSLPVTTPQHVWALGWVGHINVINEPVLLTLKDMERNGHDFS